MSSPFARQAASGLCKTLHTPRVSSYRLASGIAKRSYVNESSPRPQSATTNTTPARRATPSPAGTSTPYKPQRPTPTPARSSYSNNTSTSTSTSNAPETPATNGNGNGNGVPPTRSLDEGLLDKPLDLPLPADSEGSAQPDWSRSFHGLSATPFSPEAAAALLEPLNPDDIEIKPDGIVYLPEIKYRRILNRAFGPGGWGLAPRGETIVTPKLVTREYGLVAGGRLVSVARGEQQYFDPDGIPTATEGCKSNALMRCCKDLGVASELWDPRFIRKFTKEHGKKVWAEHVVTKKKKQIWLRKDDELPYPFKESKF
ncbi:mitochondrial genome maintenance MGM101-domain-containing protein [Phyllosticta capitalensis]|uniref:Mitochondrial genome maintenance protein MGM101 n=1 Tax=Phyllosticta capitalensis TaxID=121624 RepID=A0ABR1Z3E7_9PEZI